MIKPHFLRKNYNGNFKIAIRPLAIKYHFVWNFKRHHFSHTILSHTIFHTQFCRKLSFTNQLCHTQSFTHHLCHPSFTPHRCKPSFTHHFYHVPFLAPTIFDRHHLSHTTFLTYYLSHATLSPTIFHTQVCHPIFHTQFYHPPSFTHNFVTHDLSLLSLSPTIFYTQLCLTPSFTHIFVTHHLSRTTLSPTIFHTQLCHTLSLTQLPWKVWRLVTSTFISRGQHGTWSHPPSTWACLGGRWRRCATFRGRRGAWRHLSWFCLAGVVLGDIYLGFAWEALRLVTSPLFSRGIYCTGLGALGRRWRRSTLHGKRVTWRHLPWFCVAGVALSDIYLGFVWPTFVLRGRGFVTDFYTTSSQTISLARPCHDFALLVGDIMLENNEMEFLSWFVPVYILCIQQ